MPILSSCSIRYCDWMIFFLCLLVNIHNVLIVAVINVLNKGAKTNAQKVHLQRNYVLVSNSIDFTYILWVLSYSFYQDWTKTYLFAQYAAIEHCRRQMPTDRCRMSKKLDTIVTDFVFSLYCILKSPQPYDKTHFSKSSWCLNFADSCSILQLILLTNASFYYF